MTTMVAENRPDAGEQFAALYRSSAGDIYAYVASLLRDRTAADRRARRRAR